MLPSSGVTLFAAPLSSTSFVLQDYVPAAVVAVVVLALALALVVVSAHRKDLE
jgi:hypothetical protein